MVTPKFVTRDCGFESWMVHPSIWDCIIRVSKKNKETLISLPETQQHQELLYCWRQLFLRAILMGNAEIVFSYTSARLVGHLLCLRLKFSYLGLFNQTLSSCSLIGNQGVFFEPFQEWILFWTMSWTFLILSCQRVAIF